jgi:hypothetical protein
MIGVIQGRVTKTGSNNNGSWFLLVEDAKTRDGKPYEKRYMCGGREAPAEGARVVVQGFAYAKVDERDGNHYANINLTGCNFTVLEGGESADYAAEEYGGEIPF